MNRTPLALSLVVLANTVSIATASAPAAPSAPAARAAEAPTAVERRAARIAAAKALPALPRHDGVAALPLDQSGANRWNSTRPEVEIAVEPVVGAGDGAAASRLRVSYDRRRSTASGVAFMLPADTLVGADAIAIDVRCEPAQQLIVCLTDADGFVWSFPAVSADDGTPTRTLALTSLKPDRFQNGKRAAPKAVDLASIGMITILDISGHMGGAEVPCRWWIEAVDVRGATDPAPKVSDTVPVAGTPSSAKVSDTFAGAGGGRAARELFFEALQRDPARRGDAVAALRAAVASDARDGRSTLLLGAAHLWMASDTATPEAEVPSNLAEAIRCFDRAAALMPEDDRIPSWQSAARGFLARREGRDADVTAAIAALRPHADRDPCFHAVAYGMLAWDQPTASPAFTDAVDFANRAFDCGRNGGGSASNAPRWPYSVQGFLVGHADLMARAGDMDGAEAALLVASARPETAKWPHKRLLDERLATLKSRVERFADQDRGNDPAFAWASRSSDSCVMCHAVR